ncbi:hypothetical protein [Clostridium sp. JS66]|uniref:hypothetical protein n=1 Tax=Clostridium sp. JS66 TaxID=3064705 RepID=UPI00298DA653|nr:hypothetical protein [Clostridium sp. JS66]WPC43396.1 hypothetical protein Q6H37_07970 [Clostridium sp. JS66]
MLKNVTLVIYCIRNNVEFFIYTIDNVYSSKNNPKAKKYEILNKSFSEDLRIPIKYVNDEIIENLDEIDAFKILLVCKDTERVKLAESDFSEIQDITMVSSLK